MRLVLLICKKNKHAMKIRCEQDSIRLRLRKSELGQLRNEHKLSTAVHLPGGKILTWELLLDEKTSDVNASFTNDTILVVLPLNVAKHWMDGETVGLEAFIPNGSAHQLHVLVEKDFPCKDRPEEDKIDFFTELAAIQPPLC